MAKTSAIQKNERRRRLADKYADRRKDAEGGHSLDEVF